MSENLNENEAFRKSVDLMLELHAANLVDKDLEDEHYDEMGDLWDQLTGPETDILRRMAAYLNWTGGLLPGKPEESDLQMVDDLNILIKERDFGPRFLQLLETCNIWSPE